MSRICPHCNYLRQAGDQAPEWQCPACEKAYIKAGQPLPPASLRQYGPATEARRGGLGKWLAIILALSAAFWFFRPTVPPAADPSVTLASGEPPQVLLYVTDWCGYCKATRAFFAANGIRYTEYDIEKSSAALREHERLGGHGVPLIVVGDEAIKGYNEAELQRLLQPWIRH